MQIDTHRFREQFRVFKALVQQNDHNRKFSTFQDGLAHRWEGFKGEIWARADDRLQAHRWSASDIGSGRILDRLINAIEIPKSRRQRGNNLVAWQNRYGPSGRTDRALVEAVTHPSARRAIERWAFDFFGGKLSPKDGFDEFQRLAGNRYDVVAYLFFLKDREAFMPIATRTVDRAFRLLGIDVEKTEGRCSWANYEGYMEALRRVQQALAETGEVQAPRLIDAHSFCWMLVRLGAKPLPANFAAPLPQPIEVGLPPPAAPGAEPDDHTIVVTTDEELAELDARKRQLGRDAEKLALASERRRLTEIGHPDAEGAVKPVWKDPRHGYDILSTELDSTPRYIEVKAARHSGKKLSFFLTEHERKTSLKLKNYLFYLVLDVESSHPTVLVVDGEAITDEYLAPTNYIASVRRC